MAALRVTLSVDPATGNFTYTPTHLRAAPGDTITFVTNPLNLSFAVMFKRTSPGKKVHLHSAPGSPPGSDTVDATNVGVHQYGAAIFINDRVFVDGGCGDVGVGN